MRRLRRVGRLSVRAVVGLDRGERRGHASLRVRLLDRLVLGVNMRHCRWLTIRVRAGHARGRSSRRVGCGNSRGHSAKRKLSGGRVGSSCGGCARLRDRGWVHHAAGVTWCCWLLGRVGCWWLVCGLGLVRRTCGGRVH